VKCKTREIEAYIEEEETIEGEIKKGEIGKHQKHKGEEIIKRKINGG
jgi:hypothetical protein